MDEQDSHRVVNGLSNDSIELAPLAMASAALHRPATAIALSLVILPVLYRIGFVGSLVIVILAV